MNGKSNIGCVLLVIIAVIIGFIGNVLQFLFTTWMGWTIIAVVAGIIVAVNYSKKQTDKATMITTLETGAQIMDEIAAGKDFLLDTGFTLQKGEKLIYALPNVALTEYQSTGSSYSGGSAGVSFPLVGRIRGNVGGQSGQITKNPEQLLVVDQGRAIFTDQRIIFTGANLVRDWDLDKTVELSPGPNGINVKIAVSNRERTSGLQALSVVDFGPGYVAGYAFTLHAEGPAKAKEWAADLTKRMREMVTSLKTDPKAK